jgi:hypothetical protein
LQDGTTCYASGNHQRLRERQNSILINIKTQLQLLQRLQICSSQVEPLIVISGTAIKRWYDALGLFYLNATALQDAVIMLRKGKQL